ncbi:MAG: hypothetical protein WC608_03900 [Parcubacteria group bacterium]
MIPIALLFAVFVSMGFTACGGAYYGRNIGVSGSYIEQPVYNPGYGYGYGFPEPICGYNTSGLPLSCNAGPVAPSFQRDMWRSFYGW